MTYSLGEIPRLTFATFSDEAEQNPADPTLLTLYLRSPAGTETTQTWPGTVVRDALGVFHYDIPSATAGHWSYHWTATGAVATGEPGGFDVDPRYGPWITLADVKDETNISRDTDDDELRSVIDAACALLENHPGYTVADHVKQTALVEWYDAAPQVILSRYPVASVASVVGWSGTTSQAFTEAAWDSGTAPDYGYTVDAQRGFLYLSAGGYASSWTGRVKVTYTAGVTTVPADIRQAALVLVEHLWETQRGGQGPSLPQGLDLGDVQFESQASFAIPRRVEEMLTAYRRAPAVA